MNEIVAAKVEQAIGLLREFELPLWIVQFARETYDNPAPIQDLAVGTTVTWPAAFVLTQSGRRVAIVGSGDVYNARAVGAYDEVVGYVQDVAGPLRDVLDQVNPEHIGVSYSVNDDSSDNITHGMYLVLRDILSGTAFQERLVPADPVLVALRARKLPEEISRIRHSISLTLELFERIGAMFRPGISECEVADQVHGLIRGLGATTAWDYEYDPIVNFGPSPDVGHVGPGETQLEPGMLVHVDLGIKQSGYCSDLQRTWYLLRDGEDGAPDPVLHAFNTVVDSIGAAFAALRPGVPGWTVDQAARRVITEAGYSEPEFSTGHQLGQTTHDGGALLGPAWPRYGNRPELAVEEDMVFTLEHSLPTAAGTIGIEEDVVVRPTGAEYLAAPQTELLYVRP